MYIIDGYNLLFQKYDNLSKSTEGKIFDELRDHLCHEIEEYLGSINNKGIVVFDGHLGFREEFSKEIRSKFLEIVFTKKDETADTFIEKYGNKIKKDEHIYIVTSDHAVQDMLFTMGILRMSSLEFIKSMENEKKIIRKRQNENKKNFLGSNVDDDVRAKLEKLRRGDHE